MNVGWLDIDKFKYEPGPFIADIDECTIPELAAKCVDNAECCNLPAEYVCKCKQGFEGDGQVECRGESSSPVLVLLYPNKCNATYIHQSVSCLQSFLTLNSLFSSLKSYLFLNELEHLTIYLCHYNFGWFPSTSTKKQPEEKSYYLLFSLQWLL